MSRPSILLVVLLNVSLNTLPVLALRVIYQALKKPYPKVREAGVPTAHSQDASLCWEQGLQGATRLGDGCRDPDAHPVSSGRPNKRPQDSRGKPSFLG